MKLVRIMILFIAVTTVASNQGMDIFTQWLKKPYTSQVEYATDLLQKMVTDPEKPLPSDYDQKVKELIVQGADPNIGNGFNNPLIVAATHNHADLASFLLTHGADPNYLPPAIGVLPGVGVIGTGSALQEAVSKNNLEVIEVLLEHGANPNRPDALLRWTPLMWAIAEPPKPEIVEILLRNPKLNLSVTDSQGRTALQMAETLTSNDPDVLSKRREIARLIREYQKTKLP